MVISRSYRKVACSSNKHSSNYGLSRKRSASKGIRHYRYFDEVSNGGWYKKVSRLRKGYSYSYVSDMKLWYDALYIYMNENFKFSNCEYMKDTKFRLRRLFYRYKVK